MFIRGVTVHVFVPNGFSTGLSVRYACVSHNNWCFDSLWCGMTDRCINALESRWTVQKRADINPTQALTGAAAIGSGSRVWAVTRHRLVKSGARVNAIIPSSVLLVLTRINMTEHLMPYRSISVSTAERHQQNSVEIKCHVTFHLPQTSHQCPQLVSSLEKWSLERSISRNITPYTHYITKPVSLNYLIYA